MPKRAKANGAQDTFGRVVDYADQVQAQLLETELQRQEMLSALRVLQEKLAAAAPPITPSADAATEQKTIEDKGVADLTPAPGIQSKAAVERLVAILEQTHRGTRSGPRADPRHNQPHRRTET